MHDGWVVVGYRVVDGHAEHEEVVDEVMFDVLGYHGDVIVAVRPALLVDESKPVADLVDCWHQLKAYNNIFKQKCKFLNYLQKDLQKLQAKIWTWIKTIIRDFDHVV